MADQLAPSGLISQYSQWVRMLEYEAGFDEDSDLFHLHLQRTVRLQETLQIVILRMKAIFHANTSDSGQDIRNPKINNIDRYIMDHLSENISSVAMANYLYLNPSYFSRYFKKMTGTNFTDYVHRFKMNIAQQMIKNSDETIELISMKLGYSDRTYFSKVFKKYNGVSPGEYKTNQVK